MYKLEVDECAGEHYLELHGTCSAVSVLILTCGA